MVVINRFDSVPTVHVQVKDQKSSKSFTITHANMDDVFDRIYLFFTKLDRSPNETLKIVSRKWTPKYSFNEDDYVEHNINQDQEVQTDDVQTINE